MLMDACDPSMHLEIEGAHSGGTSTNQTTESTQFMIMQSLMKSSSTTKFNMYTYERMNTRTADNTDWVYESERPPLDLSCSGPVLVEKGQS